MSEIITDKRGPGRPPLTDVLKQHKEEMDAIQQVHKSILEGFRIIGDVLGHVYNVASNDPNSALLKEVQGKPRCEHIAHGLKKLAELTKG